MSDNPPLSSSARNSVDAADLSDKLKHGQYDDCDGSKPLRRQKPAVTAPKPKFMTSKSHLDEDHVMKNLDDMLEKEEGGGKVEVKEPGTEDHVYDVALPVTNVSACTAEDKCMASPPPDYSDDDDQPIYENVLDTPVHVNSKTSESRGSILEDTSDTPASETNPNIVPRNRRSRQVQLESVMHCHSVDLVYYRYRYCFICCE